MSDRWMMEIKCPQCGKIVETEAEQADGHAFLRDSRTYIGNDIPGFRVEQSMSKIVVHCDDCQIIVWQNPR
jgi:hypothetical protein